MELYEKDLVLIDLTAEQKEEFSKDGNLGDTRFLQNTFTVLESDLCTIEFEEVSIHGLYGNSRIAKMVDTKAMEHLLPASIVQNLYIVRVWLFGGNVPQNNPMFTSLEEAITYANKIKNFFKGC